ncbi:MAG: hypothetical protein WCH46_00805 [bacterium]
MKYISTILLLVLTSTMTLAQHSFEGDGGAGNIFIISGAGLGAGTTTFTLPPAGGTLVTTGSGLAWLTAGNTLSGGSATTPTQVFGSTNAYDVKMVTAGTEQMRLRNAGGVNIPSTNASGVGAIYRTDHFSCIALGRTVFS